MPSLDSREMNIINAIHRNYQQSLENQMITHFGVYLEKERHPEKIYSWIEKIGDIRLLSNSYLETIAAYKSPPSVAALEKKTSGTSFFASKAKWLLPEFVSNFLFNSSPAEGQSLLSFVTAEVFSLALGSSITDVLFNYFTNQFTGDSDDAKKQFSNILEKQTDLSNLIKKECERIAAELIKLFQFREMLLLGKLSQNPVEPDVRNDFINRAKLGGQSSEAIHLAIEVYFAQELSAIFNYGFQSIYQVHDVEIKSELQSPFVKWINQLSESEQIRMAFTQEIQLKFMLLSRDFLLEKMNKKGMLASHPVIFSLLAGLIILPVVAGTLALLLSGGFLWGIAAVAVICFVITALTSYFLINSLNTLFYERSADNRIHIQQSVDMINNEFLRLKREILDKKDASAEVISNTKDFEKVNATLSHAIEGRNVARGSIAGWLREYAARYRHSKAVEIDLGDEYKQLIHQSRIQTQDLIVAINHNHPALLDNWIYNTMRYLKNPGHQAVIKDFELIQKIKEQVLEVIGQTQVIPPNVLQFYSEPLEQGGLNGNKADFYHIRRMMPAKDTPNPYQFLCDTALTLFKIHEPRYASKLIFFGDPQYRQMLGIAKGAPSEPITEDNIDLYLENSYAFLLSMCKPIAPGLGLDPLQQTAQVSDEFILYRMLLLKQLAAMADKDNKQFSNEIKLKIRNVIRKGFRQDPAVIFDDLQNQIFLLNKAVQSSLTYKNNDEFTVVDVELDNIIQAIMLDTAYNSMTFKLADVLKHYMDEFLQQHHLPPEQLFAYTTTEQELNPQPTPQFVQTINSFCFNTANFLKAAADNCALTDTNVLECYKYNISLQVYKTQLRIIKNLKDLYKKDSHDLRPQMDLLLTAFKKLERFGSAHCFALKEGSSCKILFQHITTKTPDHDESKVWIKHLESQEMLIYMINHVQEELQFGKTSVRASQFFSPEHKRPAQEPTMVCQRAM